MSFEEMETLAATVSDAIMSGDRDRIAAVLHRDFAVWQNTDGYSFTLVETAKFHDRLNGAVKALTVLDRKVSGTSNGYVEEHIKRFVTHADEVLRVPSVIVVDVVDRKLRAAREYMNGSALPASVAALRREVADEATRR